MKPLKMQPTFRLNVPLPADQAMIRIRKAIKTPELNQHAVSAGQCIDFKVEESDRRFWSPHLSVQLNDTETGSEAFGRFSPRPEIWTMFMAIYFVAAITIFGALIYGYVQFFLGNRPWALVVVPINLEHYSAEFRRQCNKLEDLAKKHNHEGAAFTYMHMTTVCISCHDYVRDSRRIANQPKRRADVRLIPSEWPEHNLPKHR